MNDLPVGSGDGYVEANGIRLHYITAGNGPLVILLHGFPEFWYSWRFQLPALAERFRVVAPDLRGYNLSEKPSHGYDVATLCADVRELIGALGEQRADVIGHDWGGAIAWSFAIREPDYVRRLAILNAPHPAMMVRELRTPGQLLRSAYVGFFQLRGLAERVIRWRDYAAMRQALRSADPDGTWMKDGDIQRYVDAITQPGALSAALEYYRQLPHGFAAVSPLRVITAPTLVLWGEQDPYLGVGLLDGLERWVQNVRIERFPMAGHWLNQQEPERINRALLTFLEQ